MKAARDFARAQQEACHSMVDVEAEVDELLSVQLCDIAERSYKTHQDIVSSYGPFAATIRDHQWFASLHI